jgi:hypothetical protein
MDSTEPLDYNLKELLSKLMIFKSSFPISVATEIFGVKGGDISNLHERTLLTRIESDDVYGKIKNSEYWLYKLHPGIRNYLESRGMANNLERDYGEAFLPFIKTFRENIPG